MSDATRPSRPLLPTGCDFAELDSSLQKPAPSPPQVFREDRNNVPCTNNNHNPNGGGIQLGPTSNSAKPGFMAR